MTELPMKVSDNAHAQRTFHRERLSLKDAYAILGISNTTAEVDMLPWITQEKGVQHQYRIIRESKHDGTLVFSSDLLLDAMQNLIEGTSFFKQEPPPEGKLPRYTIGTIRRAVVYGMVDLPCGKVRGQRERITIPVRVEWVDRETYTST